MAKLSDGEGEVDLIPPSQRPGPSMLAPRVMNVASSRGSYISLGRVYGQVSLVTRPVYILFFWLLRLATILLCIRRS